MRTTSASPSIRCSSPKGSINRRDRYPRMPTDPIPRVRDISPASFGRRGFFHVRFVELSQKKTNAINK